MDSRSVIMYIYGKNVMEEAVNAHIPISHVFLNKGFKDQTLLSTLEKQHIPIRYVDRIQLDRMVTGNHQGIIAQVPDYQYTSVASFLEKENPFLVILDHLEDPHNFGAIIRSCEAAGVTGIIIPKDRSVDVNGTVMKVSAGALSNIKIAQVTNLVTTIKELKKDGFWFIGTDMEGTDYDKIDYRGKIVLVIGNEGAGMSRLVKENCDFIAKIPMQGKVNSLNASVATAIVVFEAMKHRK